jgi:uncharacterized protein YhjY with autotransporter beta-barrel domain
VLGTQYRFNETLGIVLSVGSSQGDQIFASNTAIEHGSLLTSIDAIYRQGWWKLETSFTHNTTTFDDITRQFALGEATGRQQGTTQGNANALRIELALATLLRPNWSLTPLLGFAFQRAQTDAYQEQTQDSTALNYGEQTQYSRRYKLGIAAAWQHTQAPLTIAGQFNWLTEKANNPQWLTLGLTTQTGNQAVLPGYSPDQHGLTLDITASFALNKRATIAAGLGLADWNTLSKSVGLSAQFAL